MKYRRVTAPGGTLFFTQVTFERRKIFSDEQAVALLRQAFRYVLLRHPFKIEASVVLPDHLHMLWHLPTGDIDYPTRWRLVKSYFTRHCSGSNDIPNIESRRLKGEQPVWQRRYWEHLIRDDRDWRWRVEYIHYNPVKHGFVRAPVEWKYSSFHTFVNRRLYTPEWGAGEALKIDLEVGWE